MISWGSVNSESRTATRAVYARIRYYTVMLDSAGYIPTVMVMINRDSPVAPWRQIAQVFRDKIAAGELAPGDRLPSIASLAQEYEVATTTAQKVIQSLKDEGLAVTSPMGTFVAEPGR